MIGCLIVTTKGMLRIFLTSFILVNFASLHQGKKIVCKINETAKGHFLLTVSRLSVAALWLALSFAKKNSKKNVWDQGFTHQKFRRNSYWEMFIVSLEIFFFNTLKRPMQSSYFTSAKLNANEEIPLFSLICTGLGTCELWHFEPNLGELKLFCRRPPRHLDSHPQVMISMLRPLSQHVPSNLRHEYLFDYSRFI